MAKSIALSPAKISTPSEHGRVRRYKYPDYAILADENEAADKINIARELVKDLIRRRELIVSAQVLNEFSSNAMKKGKPPLTVQQTLTHVQELSKQEVLPIDAPLVQLALQRVQQSRLSYWDALIVEAAIRSGATILYTEDMQHGTRYNTLQLINPFLI